MTRGTNCFLACAEFDVVPAARLEVRELRLCRPEAGAQGGEEGGLGHGGGGGRR